jgi:hypothetical protein
MTSNEQLMDDAREWFNGMDVSVRNQAVLTLYKMSINVNLSKVKELLNNQWSDKFQKLEEDKNKLLIENDIYKNHIIKYIESIESIEGTNSVSETNSEPETKSEPEMTQNDKLINLCRDYVVKNGESNFTKTNLENICVENGVSLKIVREMGGFKNVKKIVLENNGA